MRAAFTRVSKSKRGLSLCGQMRGDRKKALLLPGDAERCSYDVIPRSSRLGASPESACKLETRHPFATGRAVIRKAISDPVFGGFSIYTSPLVGK